MTTQLNIDTSQTAEKFQHILLFLFLLILPVINFAEDGLVDKKDIEKALFVYFGNNGIK
jgi:hypothetical protein